MKINHLVMKVSEVEAQEGGLDVEVLDVEAQEGVQEIYLGGGAEVQLEHQSEPPEARTDDDGHDGPEGAEVNHLDLSQKIIEFVKDAKPKVKNAILALTNNDVKNKLKNSVFESNFLNHLEKAIEPQSS